MDPAVAASRVGRLEELAFLGGGHEEHSAIGI